MVGNTCAFKRARRQRAEATKAGEDFIKNQMHTSTTAVFGDGGDEAGRLLHHAGSALNAWLKNDTRGAVGFGGKQRVQRGEGLRGIGADNFSGALNMDGREDVLCWKQPRGKAFVEPAAVAHGHRAEGVAVVAARQSDDAAFLGFARELPVLERKFERDLNGVGAIVAEEAAAEFSVGECGEFLGERGGLGMIDAEQRRVRDLVKLRAECGVEVGIAVAVDVGPERGGAVEVTIALDIKQPATFGAGDMEARVVQILTHLRERMP